jgi:hypothetical protein
MAVSSTMIVGMLAHETNAPRSSAAPPTSSTPTVRYAVKWGSGTWREYKIEAKTSVPLLSLE